MIELPRGDGRVLRIGHRGAPALAPENTLASIRAAVEHGVDLVEFDVLDLADGTLVLAHSDDLFEVSHGAAHGRVRSQTLEQLRGVAPLLPTLDETLAFFRDEVRGVGLHVDLKWIRYEDRVVDALRRHELIDRAILSTFFATSLLRVRELEPDLPLGFSYPIDRYGVSRRRALAPFVIGASVALRTALPRRIEGMLRTAGASFAALHYAVVSPAVVSRCHAAGAAVLTWTVDSPALLARLARTGVDGVITNDPRIFPATLKA